MLSFTMSTFVNISIILLLADEIVITTGYVGNGNYLNDTELIKIESNGNMNLRCKVSI